jgi:hypothetical protein
MPQAARTQGVCRTQGVSAVGHGARVKEAECLWGRRQPTPTPRRALELLAGCGPEGCAEAVMRAHGFAVEQLVELVRAGLATVTAQRVRAGGERVVLRITDAGWKPLKGVPQP